jgi:hypothetical protein
VLLLGARIRLEQVVNRFRVGKRAARNEAHHLAIAIDADHPPRVERRSERSNQQALGLDWERDRHAVERSAAR